MIHKQRQKLFQSLALAIIGVLSTVVVLYLFYQLEPGKKYHVSACILLSFFGHLAASNYVYNKYFPEGIIPKRRNFIAHFAMTWLLGSVIAIGVYTFSLTALSMITDFNSVQKDGYANSLMFLFRITLSAAILFGLAQGLIFLPASYLFCIISQLLKKLISSQNA